jgi:hypothetical protein
MSINRPKSEHPAMKERAATDKDTVARLKTTEAEKTAAHPHQKGGIHTTATSPKAGGQK